MTDYKNGDMDFQDLAMETKMVRGGTNRSNFGETSEAIFLNSGFCYNEHTFCCQSSMCTCFFYLSYP